MLAGSLPHQSLLNFQCYRTRTSKLGCPLWQQLHSSSWRQPDTTHKLRDPRSRSSLYLKDNQERSQKYSCQTLACKRWLSLKSLLAFGLWILGAGISIESRLLDHWDLGFHPNHPSPSLHKTGFDSFPPHPLLGAYYQVEQPLVTFAERGFHRTSSLLHLQRTSSYFLVSLLNSNEELSADCIGPSCACWGTSLMHKITFWLYLFINDSMQANSPR